jgi:hypothetical protein
MSLGKRNVVACYCRPRSAESLAQLLLLARSLAMAAPDVVLLLLTSEAGPLAPVYDELPPSQLAVAEFPNFALPEWAEGDPAAPLWLLAATLLQDIEAVQGKEALPAHVILSTTDTVFQSHPFEVLRKSNEAASVHLFLRAAERVGTPLAQDGEEESDDGNEADVHESQDAEDDAAGFLDDDDGLGPKSFEALAVQVAAGVARVPWLIDDLGRPLQGVSRSQWRGQSILRGRNTHTEGGGADQVCGAQWHSAEASVISTLIMGTAAGLQRAAHQLLSLARACWLQQAREAAASGGRASGPKPEPAACQLSNLLTSAVKDRWLARWVPLSIHDAYFGPLATPLLHSVGTEGEQRRQQTRARLLYHQAFALESAGGILVTNGAAEPVAMLHDYSSAFLVTRNIDGAVGLARREQAELIPSSVNQTVADAIERRLHPVDDAATRAWTAILKPQPACGLQTKLLAAIQRFRMLKTDLAQPSHSDAQLRALREAQAAAIAAANEVEDGESASPVPMPPWAPDSGLQLPQPRGTTGIPLALWRVRETFSDVLAGVAVRAAARRGQRVFVPADRRLVLPEMLRFVQDDASIDRSGRPIVLPAPTLERALGVESLGRGFDVHVHRIAPTAIKLADHSFRKGPFMYFRHLLANRVVIVTTIPEPVRHYLHLARRRVPNANRNPAKAVETYLTKLQVANPLAGNFGIESQVSVLERCAWGEQR